MLAVFVGSFDTCRIPVRTVLVITMQIILTFLASILAFSVVLGQKPYSAGTQESLVQFNDLNFNITNTPLNPSSLAIGSEASTFGLSVFGGTVPVLIAIDNEASRFEQSTDQVISLEWFNDTLILVRNKTCHLLMVMSTSVISVITPESYATPVYFILFIFGALLFGDLGFAECFYDKKKNKAHAQCLSREGGFFSSSQWYYLIILVVIFGILSLLGLEIVGNGLGKSFGLNCS